MARSSTLKNWVSDKLMELLGYSNIVVVRFVIQLAKQATSPAGVMDKLVDFGLPSTNETGAFSKEIFARLRRKALSKKKREVAWLVRKLQRTYDEIIDVDNDDYESMKSDARKKRYRKRVRSEVEEDREADIARVKEERPVKRRIWIVEGHDGSPFEEEETLRDQREREELERNIREKDAAAPTRLLKQNEAKEAFRRTNADIEALRRVSRQEYLKKREQKKLEEIMEDLEDENCLFRGLKLTEAEDRDLSYKKQILEIAKKKSVLERDESGNEYMIPEAYDDQECGIDQKKRFSVATQRYGELNGGDKINPFAEQKAWEDQQIEKATWNFGSKDKNRSMSADEYEFVFGDLIDFVKASANEFDDDLQAQQTRSFDSQVKSNLEKLQEERKTLPVFSYRDELLRAVEKYQVLVIVGETGSGKTTQIPQYLHEAGYTKHGKIGCTQPRRVAAMSVAARVSQEMGVKLGHEVGYSIRFEDCTSEKTVMKYMTDGMLLREFLGEPDLASYSVLMVDEAHERTLSTDILFGLVKDIARFRPDFKLLISSATLDAKKFSDYFDYCPILYIPGRRHPVDIFYTKEPQADYLDAAIATALQIHVTEPSGDIMIFLTGQEEIEAAAEVLKQKTEGLGTKIGELIICPIFANLPTELQAKVFEPTPSGARKIVLATNIAETSLTIDGIKYVIDPGFCKMKSYNPRTGMESLQVTPISKASARQRAGRSGRTSPGKCFRLYTSYSYQHDFEDNTIPEIQRTNLANVVLTLKCLGIHDLLHFDFIDAPPTEGLIKALELLFALAALNKFGELTKVGRQMAEFPLDPKLSKMIVASGKYKCSDEVISIAAMLSVGNSVFLRPKNKQTYSDNARMWFQTGNVGDHVALLNVYNEWKETNYSTEWCSENYIQARSMKRARDIREQLERLLGRVEIELISNPDDLTSIKKAIASGFFPHVASSMKNGRYRTIKYPQTAYIHPSSGLARESPSCVLYHEMVLTTREYMRCVTEIEPKWLLDVAPHYYQVKHVKNSGSKSSLAEEGGPNRTDNFLGSKTFHLPTRRLQTY
ncbi:hypothetical protein ACFX15_025904 [Malus domestica]